VRPTLKLSAARSASCWSWLTFPSASRRLAPKPSDGLVSRIEGVIVLVHVLDELQLNRGGSYNQNLVGRVQSTGHLKEEAVLLVNGPIIAGRLSWHVLRIGRNDGQFMPNSLFHAQYASLGLFYPGNGLM